MPTMTSSLAALALIGGGVSAFGQLKEGIETKKAYDYNAQIAQQEAEIVRQNAALNLYRQRKQAAEITGEQIAGYAKRGVSVTTGSPLDVVADSIANAELEIQIGQWSSEQEARRKESEAKMLKYYGKEELNLSRIKAAGTLLTSGVEAGYRFSKEKIGKKRIGE